MEIEVGDRVTTKQDNKSYVEIIIGENDAERIIESIQKNRLEIIKIERPNWSVVEEKKELLTEEEREFLKLVLKFINTEIKCITKKLKYNEIELIFSEEEDGSGEGYWYYIKNSYFKDLEERGYTLKELGLEE